MRLSGRNSEECTGEKGEYYAHVRRQKLYSIVLIIMAIVLVFVFFGVSDSRTHTWGESFKVLADHLFSGEHTQVQEMIYWNNLLPRAINGLIVGGVLGLAGAVMQIIMRNPLADPYTTGISSGAGFGATMWLTLGIAIIPELTGDIALITNAFILSLVPTGAILAVIAYRRTSPGEMILIGIGVMYFFGAATTVMMLWANPSDYANAYRWGLGHLTAVGWGNMPYILSLGAVGFALCMILSKKIGVMNFGDRSAISLGEQPHRVRVISLVIVSLVVAGMVCFTGTIGFVGIVAPHIVRLTLGSDTKFLIPGSFCMGATMLLLADTIAKVLTLPVGVITSIVGGPLFLFILIKQRKKETM